MMNNFLKGFHWSVQDFMSQRSIPDCKEPTEYNDTLLDIDQALAEDRRRRMRNYYWKPKEELTTHSEQLPLYRLFK